MSQLIPAPSSKPVVSASTVRTVTSAVTANYGDAVLADATTGSVQIMLPAATTGNARITIKKMDSSENVVTVVPQSGTIDGAASVTIATQNTSRDFATNGTNWFVI